MKKVIAIVLAFALCLALCGCGNMSLGLGNFEFNKVHVDTHHYSGCFTIEKWYTDETGIEVKTYEAGSIFLSEGMYILLSGEQDCPFCAQKENNH